jgi:predicted  nucleic acid-binding Zn-ribbon protein
MSRPADEQTIFLLISTGQYNRAGMMISRLLMNVGIAISQNNVEFSQHYACIGDLILSFLSEYPRTVFTLKYGDYLKDINKLTQCTDRNEIVQKIDKYLKMFESAPIINPNSREQILLRFIKDNCFIRHKSDDDDDDDNDVETVSKPPPHLGDNRMETTCEGRSNIDISQINHLSTSLTNLNKQITLKHDLIANHESKLTQLNVQANELQIKILDLDGNRIRLEDEISKLQKQFGYMVTTDSQIEEYKRQILDLNKEVDTLKLEKHNIQSFIKDIQDAIATERSMLDKCRYQVQQRSEYMIQCLKETIQTCRDHVSDFVKSLPENNVALSEILTDLKDTEVLIEKLNVVQEENDRECQERQANLKSEIESFNAEIVMYETKVNDLETRITRISKMYDDRKLELGKMKQTIKLDFETLTNTQQRESLEKDLNDMKCTISKLKEERDANAEQIKEFNAAVQIRQNNLDFLLDAKSKTVNKLKSSLSMKIDELLKTRLALTRAELKVKELENELHSVNEKDQSTITRLEGENKEYTETIETLKDSKNVALIDFESLKELNSKYVNDNEQLQLRLSEKENEMYELQLAHDKLQQTCTASRRESQSFEQTNTAVHDENLKLYTNLDKLEKQIKHQNVEKLKLQNLNADLQTEKADLETKLYDSKSSAKELKAQIVKLSNISSEYDKLKNSHDIVLEQNERLSNDILDYEMAKLKVGTTLDAYLDIKDPDPLKFIDRVKDIIVGFNLITFQDFVNFCVDLKSSFNEIDLEEDKMTLTHYITKMIEQYNIHINSMLGIEGVQFLELFDQLFEYYGVGRSLPQVLNITHDLLDYHADLSLKDIKGIALYYENGPSVVVDDTPLPQPSVLRAKRRRLTSPPPPQETVKRHKRTASEGDDPSSSLYDEEQTTKRTRKLRWLKSPPKWKDDSNN